MIETEIIWNNRDYMILGTFFLLVYYFLRQYGWAQQMKMSILIVFIGVLLLFVGLWLKNGDSE